MSAAPAWCTTVRMRFYWHTPWEVPLSRLRARRFKKRLWRHGKVTPHYSRSEAASHGGVKVPDALRGPCQRQGFHLERLRHRGGGKPLPILSWFRSPKRNEEVSGARFSEHLKARASDIDGGVRLAHGGTSFDANCHVIFRRGGIGTQGSFTGPVRHVDSRPQRSRWIYGGSA